MNSFASFLVSLGNLAYFSTRKMSGNGMVDAFTYEKVDGEERVRVHILGLGYCEGTPGEILAYFAAKGSDLNIHEEVSQ